MELAGIASFHASPVWVLAALADLAGAGRELIAEVAEALQEEGLLEQAVNFKPWINCWKGFGTTGRLTETVNTPPLDIGALRTVRAEVRREASSLSSVGMPVDHSTANGANSSRKRRCRDGLSWSFPPLWHLTAVRELPDNVRWLSRAAQISGRRAGGVLALGLLDH